MAEPEIRRLDDVPEEERDLKVILHLTGTDRKLLDRNVDILPLCMDY